LALLNTVVTLERRIQGGSASWTWSSWTNCSSVDYSRSTRRRWWRSGSLSACCSTPSSPASS